MDLYPIALALNAILVIVTLTSLKAALGEVNR